jgi:hypothetical protein
VSTDPAATAQEQGAAGDAQGQPSPSEDDRSEIGQRAAYEAEMMRISSTDMILQATVSLLNIGGYRLGLSPGADRPAGEARDLEQVRDAIDGARALLPILERSMPAEMRPLRDALSQLQMRRRVPRPRPRPQRSRVHPRPRRTSRLGPDRRSPAAGCGCQGDEVMFSLSPWFAYVSTDPGIPSYDRYLVL